MRARWAEVLKQTSSVRRRGKLNDYDQYRLLVDERDEGARQVVEQLNLHAGYEPVYVGPLENAEVQEHVLKLVIAISQGGMGPFFCRVAPPDQL
jgi:predicted dinucleotide-binding enzyme